mmetsp:Transcript_47985/g.108945  ORF Transcript_47985/g.108945 Transcript_47985/m.108945 type:complete len:217 (-) Transcript_47985:852-1502(-)
MVGARVGTKAETALRRAFSSRRLRPGSGLTGLVACSTRSGRGRNSRYWALWKRRDRRALSTSRTTADRGGDTTSCGPSPPAAPLPRLRPRAASSLSAARLAAANSVASLTSAQSCSSWSKRPSTASALFASQVCSVLRRSWALRRGAPYFMPMASRRLSSCRAASKACRNLAPPASAEACRSARASTCLTRAATDVATSALRFSSCSRNSSNSKSL